MYYVMSTNVTKTVDGHMDERTDRLTDRKGTRVCSECLFLLQRTLKSLLCQLVVGYGDMNMRIFAHVECH